MRGKHSNQRRGPDHPRWSEERMISEDGYVKVRVGVEHPLADRNGYAYEHLIVWVSAGNPRPPAGFLLHHRDEHRTNNRISNLELLTKREHAERHGGVKLTADSVRSIRDRYAVGEASQEALAEEYGVPHQRISKVIRGMVWKDAGGKISKNDNRTRDPQTGRIIGKKAAGALLDGREHREFPK